MIDLTQETVVSLSDAAKRLPRRRGGRRVHTSTLYRWSGAGLNGVRLETLRLGGTLCTSLEALQRFFDRLTDQARPRAGPAPADVTSRHDQSVINDLSREGFPVVDQAQP